MVITWNDDRTLGAPTDLVPDAHDAGLVVHPYTFRAANTFLPSDHRTSDDPAAHGDLTAELHASYHLGVDGVFTDHPDLATTARDKE